MKESVKEWVKTLVTSSVVAGGVSWLVTTHEIEKKLHSKEGAAGYEALVKADMLAWQSAALAEEAKWEKDESLAAEAQKLKRESDASIIVARLKIAAFGHESVVKAMGDYYSKHLNAAMPCENEEKFRSDTQIYKAIRNTLGVGGSVNDKQLATLILLCSLK